MAKLTDVCMLVMGQSPASSAYNSVGEGIPFFQGNADFGEVSPTPKTWCTAPKQVAEKGDILLSVRAPIGALNVAAEKCCIGRGLAAIRPREGIVRPGYMLFMLHYHRRFLEGKGTGSTFKAVGKKALMEFDFHLHSAKEQMEIESRLVRILNLIKLQRKAVRSLDELVESQFIEMFGDPAQNPMNWEIASLTSLGICKNGMNFKSKESGIELPCLGVGDFKDRIFINDVSEMGRVNLDTEPSEGCFLKDGDVVFVRSNGNKELVGRCLAVYPGDAKAVYSGFCIRLRIESKKVRIPYLVWVLRQPSIRRQMFGRGANVQNLNQKLMAQVMVPLPPLSEQDRFVDFVAQVDKTKAAVQQSIDKLQMLYDSLAQEYFGGDRQ